MTFETKVPNYFNKLIDKVWGQACIHASTIASH
jgi:hypothetical protein